MMDFDPQVCIRAKLIFHPIRRREACSEPTDVEEGGAGTRIKTMDLPERGELLQDNVRYSI